MAELLNAQFDDAVVKDSKKETILIWAVDPGQNPKESKNLILEMKMWAKALKAKIQPVAVYSKSIFNLPMEVKLPWEQKIDVLAKKSLESFLIKSEAKKLLPLADYKLLFTRTGSKRDMVTSLTKYAENKNAKMIFVYTRAKKTYNPFRLGGFAEILVTASKTPVLLLNPDAKLSPKISSILIPTDFGKEAKNCLHRVEPWAKALHAQVLLYNQVETPNLYPSEFNGVLQSQTLNIDTMMKDIETSRKKKANEWTKELKADHIKSTPVIERQKSYLSEAIITAAKKNKASLIALASKSGPLAQTLLGSVARDVVLQASCPVVVFFKPKAVRKRLVKTPERYSPSKLGGTTPEAMAMDKSR